MTSVDSNGFPSTPTRLEGKGKATVVCWFLGLGSLMAWNSIMTIADYYYALFPLYHPSRVLTLVYQPFAVGTMLILAYNEAKINTRMRNIFGYILFSLGTLGLIVLDLATGGKGGIGNYIGICIFVAAFGVADAHVQGGLVGDLSFMCPEFIQSMFAGLAASGALTSGLRLMTKAIFDKSNHGLRKGVVLFLAISTAVEFLLSSDLAAAGILTTESESVVDAKDDRLSNKQLLSQNVDYALDLYLIYVLTLSIFPGFLYENTGSHHLGSWYSIVLIAVYNVWDLVSRYIPLIECIKIESRKGLLIACLSRFLLVPAFYFTAKYADQGWMIFLVSFLGLTNGYLTVCVLTAAPKGYKAPEQNALGNLMVVFLLGGIFTGVALDWLWLIGNGKF
ncbi:unnamed protein product [Fraxinus pennsylvanica]|uniref:Equilibrative nucleoside transporter n=1 Tax=Fraxinus pennsylvanica TaxID=56036 RepID=A0AAD1YPY9_9LAMI|nr:unnamed protein product [Fraxinus pennsylvanica]